MSGQDLASVTRIGAPLPRTSVPCPACQGSGWREEGFIFGSNVGTGHFCRQCNGSGQLFRDLPPPPEAA